MIKPYIPEFVIVAESYEEIYAACDYMDRLMDEHLGLTEVHFELNGKRVLSVDTGCLNLEGIRLLRMYISRANYFLKRKKICK